MTITHTLGLPYKVSPAHLHPDMMAEFGMARKGVCDVCGIPLLVWKISTRSWDLCGRCDTWADLVGKLYMAGKTGKTLTVGELFGILGQEDAK